MKELQRFFACGTNDGVRKSSPMQECSNRTAMSFQQRAKCLTNHKARKRNTQSLVNIVGSGSQPFTVCGSLLETLNSSGSLLSKNNFCRYFIQSSYSRPLVLIANCPLVKVLSPRLKTPVLRDSVANYVPCPCVWLST